MVIDVHKAIISNAISKNLLKPWGSDAKANSLRSKLFNNIQVPVIPLKNKLIFVHILVKYTKFMTLLYQIMIDAQCFMT